MVSQIIEILPGVTNEIKMELSRISKVEHTDNFVSFNLTLFGNENIQVAVSAMSVCGQASAPRMSNDIVYVISSELLLL